tara:strand:- start:8377 stop:9906 length:1530 start_codon:yes stop_codon:yes gene_type:complete
MKNLAISLLLIAVCIQSIAQNWNLFQADSTYNFEAQSPVNQSILGVRIDSIQQSQLQQSFFFSRIVNDTVNQNFGAPLIAITDISQPNIFGIKAILRNDSVILKNQFGSYLYLKPNATLGNSWTLLNKWNETIITTVDSSYTEILNGSLDSLKRWSFQCYDSNGNIKSHRVNQMKFIISKSNGIIHTPNFYENIEGVSTNNSYKNSYNRNFVSTFYSRADQLELNVGDEYHLRTELSPHGPPNTEYHNFTLLNKYYSTNNDTLYLVFDVNSKGSALFVDYSTNPPTSQWNHTYWTRLDTKKIVHPTQLVDSNPAMQPIITNKWNFKISYTNVHSYKAGFAGGPYNNRLVFKPNNYIALFDSSSNSWVIDHYYYHSVREYKHYIKGITFLDEVYYPISGGSSAIIFTYLDYYKVGSETYGNPNILSSLEAESIELEKALFYPNPAQNKININSAIPIKELQIFNINGQLVQQFKNPISEIDLSSFKAGVYLLKAILIDGTVYQEKLIIQH